jgi:hypothetical protein
MIDLSEDAFGSTPLAEKLANLREISARGSLDTRLQQWAADRLDIDREQTAIWCARALWGVAAGELIGGYLSDEALIDEAMDLLDPHDWSSVDGTLASAGAIITGSHLGPPSFLMNVVMRRYKDAFILNNKRDMPNWLTAHHGNIHDPGVAEERSLIMLKAAAYIRKGGLLFGTPDVGHSDTRITIDDPMGKRRISFGIPALARLLKVRSFPMEALWEGNRIVIKSVTLASPSPDLDTDSWNTEWAAGYWRHIKTVITQSPENNRRLKRLFRKERFIA